MWQQWVNFPSLGLIHEMEKDMQVLAALTNLAAFS